MSVTTPSNLKAAVADDHFMAPLSAGMLRGLGFKQVAEVNDTVALRKLLASERIGLLLLDDDLGPDDTLEMVRQLRADTEAANRTVPILMTFTQASKERILAARDAGVTEFLKKPLSANVINLRLTQALEHPRPFVEAQVYTGPDRRRRALKVKGERRQKD